MNFKRYAVYFCPEGALGDFGAVWLGWDVWAGRAVPVPPERAKLVAKPHRYGFHATLMAPFELAQSETEAALRSAVAEIAAGQAPFEIGLTLGRLGPFFALVLGEPSAQMRALEAGLVTGLNRFRAPLSAEAAQRRTPWQASAAQRENVARWGYANVLEDFTFHMTLTGAVRHGEEAVEAELCALLPGARREPVAAVCLCGEGADGRFRVIERFALG